MHKDKITAPAVPRAHLAVEARPPGCRGRNVKRRRAAKGAALQLLLAQGLHVRFGHDLYLGAGQDEDLGAHWQRKEEAET